MVSFSIYNSSLWFIFSLRKWLELFFFSGLCLFTLGLRVFEHFKCFAGLVTARECLTEAVFIVGLWLFLT